jgi:hypothetical protein
VFVVGGERKDSESRFKQQSGRSETETAASGVKLQTCFFLGGATSKWKPCRITSRVGSVVSGLFFTTIK